MNGPPRFAVVGHPNKGKSSIVATLSEDHGIAIARESGTTVHSRAYPLQIDGETLYELVDTPGFQRARAVLAWLHAHERGASSRAAVLRDFVAAHADDPDFRSEVELLRPIIDGAGILYVVDGARPYSREYEAEMEILRWSGQPRMALINLIGEGDHVGEWRRALDQYFAIVRVFDAVRADFDRRIDLLRAFGELHEPWAAALGRAATAIGEERARRRHRAAAIVTSLLCASLCARVSAPFEGDRPDDALKARLVGALQGDLRHQERSARRQVQELYRHGAIDLEEGSVPVLADDLFSAQSFSIFGLSTTQLALTGAASGAVAAGGIDLLLGGASLGLATALGAVAGGVATLFGAERVARVRVLGESLGDARLQVGPIHNPNFPWVVLGRALLHHRLVAERNHALRERFVLDATASEHASDQVPLATRRELERCFRTLRESGEVDAITRDALTRVIESLLGPD